MINVMLKPKGNVEMKDVSIYWLYLLIDDIINDIITFKAYSQITKFTFNHPYYKWKIARICTLSQAQQYKFLALIRVNYSTYA
jgi:hypothetical protein